MHNVLTAYLVLVSTAKQNVTYRPEQKLQLYVIVTTKNKIISLAPSQNAIQKPCKSLEKNKHFR